ncbi:hypothetical protein [Zavarzinella formosa]|uniref:hypothetical protein n=1 Tax=Zavarzinella formosa TaxID=360055 RepID=UPI000310E9A5|nr:hypothetical protein [Zavarzinella formosa]
MTRSIDTATEAASQDAAIHPVLFVELLFDSGPVRFHSELGTLAFGGNDFTGTGRLGGISQVDEDTELARTPLTLTLGGIPSDMISVVLNEHYQGRRATLYVGYLDLTTRVLVADPIILYRGRMDTPTVSQGSELNITLNVESRFSAWDRPNVSRYNNADQQARHPGDRGLEYVEQTTDRQINWGVAG